MNKKVWVEVTVKVTGLHCWIDAPTELYYLKYLHRHEFIITVRHQVYSNDREVEFFKLAQDVKNCIYQNFQRLAGIPGVDYDFGPRSCEEIADVIFVAMKAGYVSVSEDGENRAIVEVA